MQEVQNMQLKDLIKTHGYTINYVSSFLGIDRSSLWRKIKGKSSFKGKEINQLCLLLHVSKEDLTDESNRV